MKPGTEDWHDDAESNRIATGLAGSLDRFDAELEAFFLPASSAFGGVRAQALPLKIMIQRRIMRHEGRHDQLNHTIPASSDQVPWSKHTTPTHF